MLSWAAVASSLPTCWVCRSPSGRPRVASGIATRSSSSVGRSTMAASTVLGARATSSVTARWWEARVSSGRRTPLGRSRSDTPCAAQHAGEASRRRRSVSCAVAQRRAVARRCGRGPRPTMSPRSLCLSATCLSRLGATLVRTVRSRFSFDARSWLSRRRRVGARPAKRDPADSWRACGPTPRRARSRRRSAGAHVHDGERRARRRGERNEPAGLTLTLRQGRH